MIKAYIVYRKISDGCTYNADVLDGDTKVFTCEVSAFLYMEDMNSKIKKKHHEWFRRNDGLDVYEYEWFYTFETNIEMESKNGV